MTKADMTADEFGARYELAPNGRLRAKPKTRAKGAQRKYRNEPTEYTSPLHGRLRCASKLEARLYMELDARAAAGQLAPPYWLPQVPVPLGFPAGSGRERKMVVDAMAFPLGAKPELLDAKGVATKDWLLKRDLVRERLGAEVRTWPR